MNIYFEDDDRPDVTVGTAVATRPIDDLITGGYDRVDVPVDDRVGYIGGSDAAVICGLSPWKTELQLYQEKLGILPSEDLSNNERVYWGTILEEVVAREYAARTGRKIRRVNRLIRHREHPFIAGHIDRNVLNEDRILECKTADGTRAADWGEEGSEEIPLHYMPQVQHYLLCSGASVCDVAVLIGGNRLRIYEVPRDDEFIDGLVALERSFWDRVIRNDPPRPTTTDEARMLWAHSRPGEIIATEGAFDAAQQLVQLKADIKALEDKKQQLELELMMQLGVDGDTLTYRGQKLCTWKTQVANRFDTKGFEADHPDLYAVYKRPVESRVFRLSLKAAKE